MCERVDRRGGGTFFTQSHCSEDDFEVSLCLRWTGVIAHSDGDERLGEGFGLSRGHLDYAVDSLCPLGNSLEK